MPDRRTPIRLIVGLGNPGADYAQTRHNIGFWFVDELAARHGGRFRSEAKFHGEIGRIRLGHEEPRLLKPMTFMNRSGQAVVAAARFYKIDPETVLVVHDDLDLDAGVARLKRGGGHGGHNGLRDIIQCFGRDFARLRLGVGHPGHKDRVLAHVLHRPAQDEEITLRAALEAAADLASELAVGEWDKAVRELHSR